LADVRVVTGDAFGVNLATNAVSLLGSIRDRNADGDNALVKIDEGLDLNRNGRVDFTAPGNAAYGFEEFTGSGSTRSPGLFNSDGNGRYALSVDAAALSEGYHHLTVRAFRHRTDGGPAVYQDFKETIYVDRLKPVSSINSFNAFSGAQPGEADAWFKSDDMTANGMHVLLNLPGQPHRRPDHGPRQQRRGRAEQIDRDVFKRFFGNANGQAIGNGNNVFTLVTFEVTGNSNVQRLVGVRPASMKGAGFGDTNFDGAITTGDIANTAHGFEAVLYSRNNAFNPAADLNADGLVDTRDAFALEAALRLNSTASVKNEMRQLVLRRGNISNDFGTTAFDIDLLFDRVGKTGDIWLEDLDVDNAVTAADVDALVRQVFQSQYGDANLDLRVDFADFVLLSNNFAKTAGGRRPTSTATTSPTSPTT
jgi:hypothetical protein